MQFYPLLTTFGCILRGNIRDRNLSFSVVFPLLPYGSIKGESLFEIGLSIVIILVEFPMAATVLVFSLEDENAVFAPALRKTFKLIILINKNGGEHPFFVVGFFFPIFQIIDARRFPKNSPFGEILGHQAVLFVIGKFDGRAQLPIW